MIKVQVNITPEVLEALREIDEHREDFARCWMLGYVAANSGRGEDSNPYPESDELLPDAYRRWWLLGFQARAAAAWRVYPSEHLSTLSRKHQDYYDRNISEDVPNE